MEGGKGGLRRGSDVGAKIRKMNGSQPGGMSKRMLQTEGTACAKSLRRESKAASLRKSKGQCSWAKRGTNKLVQLRPGGADAPWRPRWNFALEGTGEPRLGPKLGRNPGSRASLLPSPLSVLTAPTAPLAFQSPSSLRPWRPRCSPPAHRGSGFRPPRAPSAAPLHRRRRHLPLAAVTLRNHSTRRIAGKWSPPTSASAPTALAAFRPPLRNSGRTFISGFRAPCLLGKCSPVTGGGTERGLRLLGNGVHGDSRSLDG